MGLPVNVSDLQIVSSLDTSLCVMSIERFIAQRNRLTVISLDNGTNSRILQSCLLVSNTGINKLLKPLPTRS